MNENKESDDPFDLARFISAQEGLYDSVLSELRSGKKRSHWMWFVFPQIAGLGHSSTAVRFAIKSREEAQHYLHHPILGTRLLECADLLLAIKGRTLSEIFGFPDDQKLKSSMTLFASIAEPNSVFVRVLEHYCHGQRDERTIQLLDEQND